MISQHDAQRIIAALRRAEACVAEHAVEQSWRADAMKVIGEKLLVSYHTNMTEEAHEVANLLKSWQGTLAGRIEARQQEVPRPTRAKRAS